MRIDVFDKESLLNAIRSHDIVSFDIFDTLIMRKTMFPEDVFYIMQEKLDESLAKDFVVNRNRAILENNIPNPNIYQIYEKYVQLTGISPEDKERILKLELELEESVLIRREDMYEILMQAHLMGKKVFLITDMYLPTHILIDILQKLGITQYDDILVSCDYRTLKGEELFVRFKEKYSGKNYLHIGDNMYSDIECAERNGMDCIPLKSGLRLFRDSNFAMLEEKANNLVMRNMIGYFIAHAYNSPFASSSMTIELEQFVILFICPVVYCMLAGLRKLLMTECYDRVLFAARDGYLFKRLYDFLNDGKVPTSIYFYTSRKAVVSTDLEEENQMLWLANLPYSFDADQILSKVFMLNDVQYKPDMGMNENVICNAERIKEKSRELRRNYQEYIRGSGLADGKYLFVDLVSSGTCQVYLEKLIPGEIEGFYLCKLKTQESKKESLKVYSLFVPQEVGEMEYAFHKMYYLFEYILTSLEPSLQYFDNCGKAVFGAETRSKDELVRLKEIQDNIEEYVQNMIYLCNGAKWFEPEFADSFLTCFLASNEHKMGQSCALTLVDDWMNTKILINK